MSAQQDHINAATPLGARLIGGGATFAVWAPGALQVFLARDAAAGWTPNPDDELVRDPATQRWTGFFPGVTAGTRYRFFVVGPGGSGLKRDPRARELDGGHPESDCIVVDPDEYPWHDQGFVRPALDDLVVYQFHVGAFYACDDQGNDLRPTRSATFLDALDRVAYLADLGVTAVQPLPVVEFRTPNSLGYNGTDLYSPERDYTVPIASLPAYVARVNAHLAAKGCAPLAIEDLSGQAAQLRAFVDIFHLYGLAVIFDVVYNHAGGELDPQSIDHFDFPSRPDNGNSIYFNADGLAGGRVFAFGTPEVGDFLIENALMFLTEYHADGFRFDEVSVIDREGGWAFCQRLTAALHAAEPNALLIAEYWGEHRWLATTATPDGMGFDIGYADGLREGVRGVIQAATAGAPASIDVAPLSAGWQKPANVAHCWQAYNCIENHDLVLDADGDHRYPRIPRLADAIDARSWYARSRARVATGALLTAPGTPMLFMGQEFLEDKLWSDYTRNTDTLIWWDGLDGADPAMADFHRFTGDLIRLRRRHSALRTGTFTSYPVDNTNRVAIFHCWDAHGDDDLMVILSLGESTFSHGSYGIGLPQPGHWDEIFNSDRYDDYPNPQLQDNGAGVDAVGPPRHGMNQSGGFTIPANSILVFSRSAPA